MLAKRRQMKCSVIIPCYNQASYLPVAVESVLNQTYRNCEIVIVVDGSPDNSYEVACKLAEKSSSIVVYNKENGGLSDARNYGIARATGEIILPLDADDKIDATYVEKAMRFFEGDDKDLIVYSDAVYFGNKSGPVKLNAYSVYELCLSNMLLCTAFYRKSAWLNVGGYDINMKYGWEDWEFWISLVKQGSEAVKINEPLFYYYRKPSSMSTEVTMEHKYYCCDYIWKKHKSFILEQGVNPLIIVCDKVELYSEINDLKIEINALHQSKAFRLARIMKKFRSVLTSFR